MIFIQNEKNLQEVCAKLEKSSYFAIDTEFIRERTFWPELCLIQIANDEVEACIDAKAGLDMSCFYQILDNPNIIKVFHSCRQDLEIFYNQMGRLPQGVFDTQVAAMVCGMGEMISYQNLVDKVLGIVIDKGQRFTDWSYRPLSEKQIKYALYDVTYLKDAYKIIHQKMLANGRLDWISSEMKALLDVSLYQVNPDVAWKRLKVTTKDKRTLSVLYYLAKWRELEAMRTNRPRKLILKDDCITELASCLPADKSELESMRGLPKGFAKSRLADSVLYAIRQGLAADLTSAPAPLKKNVFPKTMRPLLELLELLLTLKSADSGVAGHLIASVDDLEAIALFQKEAKVKTLIGWRLDLFGKDALALCRGELAISYDSVNQKVVVK